MLTNKKIISTIEKNKIKIKHFGVTNIELFGSYASGKATAKSDIDFIVEFQKSRGGYRDMLDILHFLESLFNKEIDLVKSKLILKDLKPYILGGERIAAKL